MFCCRSCFFRRLSLRRLLGFERQTVALRLLAAKPSSHIWETYSIYEAEKQSEGKPLSPDAPLAERKKQFPSDFREITVHTDSRVIPAPLTERIRLVWERMLLNAKHPKIDPNGAVGVDGETFHFSMWVIGHGWISGEVWSPERGRTVALIRLAEALADYAREKADEKKLTQLLKPLER